MTSVAQTIDVLGFPVVTTTRHGSDGWVTSIAFPMPSTIADGPSLSGKDFLEWRQTIRGTGDTAAAAVADFATQIQTAASQRHADRTAASAAGERA